MSEDIKIKPSVLTQLNDTSPLVSVIMPCYNAEPYLKEALNSIVNQTYRNLEIIAINDGSSDQTGLILSSFQEKDDRIVLIHHEKNLGLIASLNQGVDLAKGTYIARMDADDISEFSRLEALLKYLLHNPATDLVSSGFCFMNRKGNKLVSIPPKATLPLSLKFISLFGTPLAHAAVLGKAVCFKKFHYDKNYIHSEDYDLFSRMAHAGIILSNIPALLYRIRTNPSGVSSLYESKQIESHIKVSRRNIDLYFGISLEESVHRVAINRIKNKADQPTIQKAIKFLEFSKREYFKKEPCTNYERFEIEQFLEEQRLDILIQLIKNSGLSQFSSIIPLLSANMKGFVKSNTWRYAFQKIRMRFIT